MQVSLLADGCQSMTSWPRTVRLFWLGHGPEATPTAVQPALTNCDESLVEVTSVSVFMLINCVWCFNDFFYFLKSPQDGRRTQRICRIHTYAHNLDTSSGLPFVDFYIPHSFQTYTQKTLQFIPRLINEKIYIRFKKGIQYIVINVRFGKIVYLCRCSVQDGVSDG